jgi:hypothetical protein
MNKVCTQCSTPLTEEDTHPSLLAANRCLCGLCAKDERIQLRARFDKARAAFEKSNAVVRRFNEAACARDFSKAA